MEIENETIKALKRQIKNAEQDHKFWNDAKTIVGRGGNEADILAVWPDIHPNLARAAVNRDNLMHHTQNIATSGKRVNFLKKKLEIAIQKETEIRNKKGIL